MPRTNPALSPDAEGAGIASAVEVVGSDGAVRDQFLIMPFGNPFKARDGRSWILRDRDHAEQVLAMSKDFWAGTEMMIDYDHQAAYAADGVGNQAPAAAWVKSLTIGDDGIHAKVEWTAPARAALEQREYRYISPDFRFAKKTGEVTRIVRASLTNSPALDLPALAHVRAGKGPEEEPQMKTITLSVASVAALAAALAVKPEDLDEAKVVAGVKQLGDDRTASDAALTAIRAELEIDADADQAVAIAAIRERGKAEVDPSKFVPKAGFDDLNARLKSLEEEKVLASVDEAVAAGKIAPAMKQWAIDLGKKDAAALASFIDQAVPFAGGKKIEGDLTPKKGELTEDERAICAMSGISEAEFLKTRDGATEEAA